MPRRSSSRPLRARPARVLAGAVGAAVAAALLASCDAPADGPVAASPSPSSAAPSPPDPAPTAVSPTPAPVVVRSGDVVLEVTAHDVTTTEDGTTRIAVDPADGTPATLVLPAGQTFTVGADGSATVEDDDGTAVGGLTAPTGRAWFDLVAPDTLEIVAHAPATTTLGADGVVSATWGDREGGESLAVDATAWARRAGQAGVDVVWAELVADDPDVDTPTMHDQLVCHAIGAPDKATWNLEPWRPDVGLVEVLAARCNPT